MSTPHWLIEVDCEDRLNFFEVHTLNTYNLNNCTSKDKECGEYINLMYYSIFNENQIYSNTCNIGGRELEYIFKPVNMSGSSYDLTPHFTLDLIIDNRLVNQDLPLFPSPLYNSIFFGLKIESIRLNNNLGSVEIIVSDDELYQELNLRKMNTYIHWLWDSSYMSAFDPKWESSWKPITETDIWNRDNFSQKEN